MDKPETTAPEAAAVPEAPPAAPAPVKAAEVTTSVSGAATPAGPARAKSEKALRLAQALRENLRRRKVAAKPARPSN